MIIPPLYEQTRMIQELFEISKKVNMKDLNGIFMKLIIIYDSDTINRLIKSLSLYNEKRIIIDSIINYTNNISINIKDINI